MPRPRRPAPAPPVDPSPANWRHDRGTIPLFCRHFAVVVPVPASGRTYTTARRVRLGDVRPSGRLRLDALARYLQDIANDDATDAGLENAMAWVVRRVVFELAPGLTSFRDDVELVTFCGGTGSRWAERRTDVGVGGEVLVRAAALWVHVDPVRGRPAPLPPEFLDLYGEAAGGRTVAARLRHEPPPDNIAAPRRWALRATDLDLLGHVNNAIALATVEDSLIRDEGLPRRLEVEYRDAIEWEDDVQLFRSPGRVWLVVDGRVRVSAVTGD